MKQWLRKRGITRSTGLFLLCSPSILATPFPPEASPTRAPLYHSSIMASSSSSQSLSEHTRRQDNSMEASVFAESALMDKETGRIFWEAGGHQSTVSKSLRQKLGFHQSLSSLSSSHSTLAVTVSIMLWFSMLGYVHTMLRQVLLHLEATSPLFERLIVACHQYRGLRHVMDTMILIVKNVLLGTPRFNTWYALG